MCDKAIELNSLFKGIIKIFVLFYDPAFFLMNVDYPTTIIIYA